MGMGCGKYSNALVAFNVDVYTRLLARFFPRPLNVFVYIASKL